jgi:chromosome segregation ATPase
VGEDVSEAAGKALAMAALQDEVVSLRTELSDVKSEATSLQHQLDEAIRQKIRMQDERDQFEREVKEAEHKVAPHHVCLRPM